MFRVSDYRQQAEGLPRKNSYQLKTLEWADAATFFRETSKWGTIAGVTTSIAVVAFNRDPTFSLIYTAINGTAWLVFKTCANHLEPQAQEMIQYFKDLRDGKVW